MTIMTHHHNLGLAFQEIVQRHSDRRALNMPGNSLGYADLDRLADRFAALMLARGCRRGDVVAIAMNKEAAHYAIMLAALRLGIAYVNLDPASPEARNSRIVATARPRLMFISSVDYRVELEKLAELSGVASIVAEAVSLPVVDEESRGRIAAAMARVDGASIAYIMFTSGSTGIPKGVAVTHENVLHFINWGQTHLSVSPEDNFTNINPLYFDNSVFDFYLALFSGASLTPVERGLLNQPYKLVEHVAASKCSIWFSVPSLLIYLNAMKALDATALSALRFIVFGGEGYPKTELRKLYQKFHPRAVLVNVYGPTECTCICSAHNISDDDFTDMVGLPTLGHLNPNFDYCIYGDNDEEAEVGELCLIGPNVAAGYFNDLERTAASFFTLAEPSRFMKRMYRTGDIVRESEGRLYFVGRKDNQIKHMGYRIELEEIEQALSRLPEVTQAAVVYHRRDAAYGRLIGFVAADASVDDRDVLAKLGNFVPDYMIPSRLVIMDVLPKNSNGKIDKHALLATVDGLPSASRD